VRKGPGGGGGGGAILADTHQAPPPPPPPPRVGLTPSWHHLPASPLASRHYSRPCAVVLAGLAEEFASYTVVLEWARNVLANRLATDARSWAALFSRYASGTYTNRFEPVFCRHSNENWRPVSLQNPLRKHTGVLYNTLSPCASMSPYLAVG
jgi:hypothetical protein